MFLNDLLNRLVYLLDRPVQYARLTTEYISAWPDLLEKSQSSTPSLLLTVICHMPHPFPFMSPRPESSQRRRSPSPQFFFFFFFFFWLTGSGALYKQSLAVRPLLPTMPSGSDICYNPYIRIWAKERAMMSPDLIEISLKN